MTEPSQYFKGRTVQEQMNEVIGYVDVRSAEVATDAIAADVAQVHQDMLDADADAQAAAASAAAAAGTLTNAVKKTGEASQSIAGDIAVSGTLSGGVVTGTVITAPAPVNNTDAANKKYVDDQDAAMKTYVDGQDATKINITDINQYAVGLTGNQDNIKSKKSFDSMLFRMPQGRIGNTQALRICSVPATASTTYVFNVLSATRYGVEIFHMTVALDGDAAITSVSDDSITTAVSKSSHVGAYVEDGSLYITVRPSSNNSNISAIILNAAYGAGLAITNFDYSMNPSSISTATTPGYVEGS